MNTKWILLMVAMLLAALVGTGAPPVQAQGLAPVIGDISIKYSANGEPAEPSIVGWEVLVDAAVTGLTPEEASGLHCDIDFGDGDLAIEQPLLVYESGFVQCEGLYTYTTGGTHVITMTVVNANGTGTSTLSHEVVYATPVIQMVVVQDAGNIQVGGEPSVTGQSVKAYALTTNPGSVKTCTFDYGDGAGAEAGTLSPGWPPYCIGPAHTYTAAGTYTITATVDGYDSSTNSFPYTHIVEILLLEQLPDQSNAPPSDSAACSALGICSLAQNFKVGAQPVTIDQVQLWGLYIPATAGGPGADDYADSFTVAFYADASGSPGQLAYKEDAVSGARATTGVTVTADGATYNEYLLTLTLAVPQTLGAGDYWIEIYNSNGAPDTNGLVMFMWEIGGADTLGMGLGSTGGKDADGVWAVYPITLALRLIGTSGPVLAVSPDTLPLGTQGAAYSQQFSAAGGSGSYTFSLTGTLPSGMSLTGDTLSGTPTEKGSFPITVKAVDVSDPTLQGQREYVLTIGMLDLSFGTDGRVITGVQRTHRMQPNSTLQPDGKIVVLATEGSSAGVQLERYNQNGTLDTEFGTDGLVTTPLGDIPGATSVDTLTIAIAPDDHILVSTVISDEIAYSPYYVLIRYNADGSLDTGFGAGGFLALNTPTLPLDYSRLDYADVIGVHYQQDGKIIVAGTLLPETNDAGPRQGQLMRFYEDGGTWKLDPSFDTDGIATFLESGTNTMFNGLDVLATGEIVVGVNFGTWPDFRSSVLRYSANGALAKAYASRAGHGVAFVYGLPDGTVYTLGSTDYLAPVLLVRYLPTGEIDSSGFGTAGEVSTKFGGDRAGCSSLLVQPDGKPVLACYYGFETPSYHSFFAVARFNTDGTPDDSFFTGGVFATPFDDPGEPTVIHGAQAVYLTSEGKLLATGYIGFDQPGELAVLAQYDIGITPIGAPVVTQTQVVPEPSLAGYPMLRPYVYFTGSAGKGHYTCSVDFGDGTVIDPGRVEGRGSEGSGEYICDGYIDEYHAYYTYANPGTYTIKFTIKDIYGNQTIQEVQHTVVSDPDPGYITWSPEAVVENQPVMFSTSQAAQTYSWYVVSGPGIELPTAIGTDPSLTFTFSSSGTYKLMLLLINFDAETQTFTGTADGLELQVVPPTSADLSITSVDSKDPVKPGAQLVYTLTARNLGPDPAQTVTLTDTLDRNTKYVSVAAPRGWTCRYVNYAVTCTKASLASGASAVIKITVTVNKTAKLGKELVNNAAVSSATYDPVTTNNSVVQKTMVAK